jgi:phospholipase/carboxylesterase
MSSLDERRPSGLSRRHALLAATTSLACRPRPRLQAAAGGAAPPDWAGLEMSTAGRMREDEVGGAAVVLLHGWGAPGDDLVPLARELDRPRTRFFMPAGPLPEMGGGRAWWHLDPNDRPVHAWDDQETAGHQPHHQVLAARAAVQTVLRTIQSRYRPDTLLLGGFSQGAMLSLDVALAAAPAVDKVAALSGVMLADSLGALKTPRPKRPPVFVSHGRRDDMLAYKGGEKAKELLERHGYQVTFHPFDGGHAIPPDVVEGLRKFLFEG